ncbi:MAG TPA: flagellar hook assembly protein FlgD [candidate division Zixibacteria bacterium]|nr:flagellar hook assembly protein FlgD [candidate division Zixibacteria bacterium]
MIISPQATDTRGNAITTGAQQVVGKDEFLKLFVTKLKHQDPLDPMKDEDFIAQLAQFSSLEQLTNMNANLESSINWDVLNNQTINNSIAAQLIGTEVVAELSEVYLSSHNAPKIAFELPEPAASVSIQILDRAGNVVRTLDRQDVPAGHNSIVWDGKDENGERMPEGTYTLAGSAVGRDGGSLEPSLSMVGVVSGVVYRGGIAFLKLDGAEVALGDVREINEFVED